LNFILISFPKVLFLKHDCQIVTSTSVSQSFQAEVVFVPASGSFSPRERQRLTDARCVSERAKQRRQAQAYGDKQADGCEVGPAVEADRIRSPRCAVSAGSIFHSHGFPLLSNLKPPFTA
jgi:hypothetical protein